MSRFLILEPSGNRGCEPDEQIWQPPQGRWAYIINNSGFDQTLTNITPGALSPSPGGEFTIVAGGFVRKRVGRRHEPPYTYNYDDGLPQPADFVPRTGTIDPS